MIRDKRIVPVLMFHSVGLQDYRWCWNHLSQPLEVFEGFLKILVRSGFRTIGLPDLQAHMRGETEFRNAIVLTFDDGYLDNWVYVAPLLRRYGMHGTVFVNPEFVDPGRELRPTLQDTWQGRCSLDALRPAGFMNWKELRKLDAEGVLDVQSHALSHTWHFTGPRIVGWHRGEQSSPWPWLAWNAYPERKPFYMTEDQSSLVPPGHPVFEHRQALVAHRFFPDPAVMQKVIDYVGNHGSSEFFQDPNWESRLRNMVDEATNEGPFPGNRETMSEREARIRYELAESRKVIGWELNKSVDYVCWPAGGSDDLCETLARECGYVGWTLRSNQERHKRNLPGVDPSGIKRMGMSSTVNLMGRQYGTGSPRFHLSKIYEHQHSAIHALMTRAYKVAASVSRNR